MKKVYKNMSWEIAKSFLFSATVLFLFFGGYLFYRIKIFPTIPGHLQQDAKRYIGTIFIICVSFVIQRFVGTGLFWYAKDIACKTKSEFDDKLIPLLRKVLKVIIWVMAFVIILPFYGVNISALIAALGVGSLAIALAAQDTIANIIAGFMIIIDTPFRIGDRIKLPSGEVAEVLDVGIRRSSFLSEDKTKVFVVPNLDLSKSKIENFTYAEEMSRHEAKRNDK